MVLKWLKKLFYGTKDGLPQKKVSEHIVTLNSTHSYAQSAS